MLTKHIKMLPETYKEALIKNKELTREEKKCEETKIF